jgi:hypothetical protein
MKFHKRFSLSRVSANMEVTCHEKNLFSDEETATRKRDSQNFSKSPKSGPSISSHLARRVVKYHN